ncbi:seryl-tRNA synthetase (serin-tRNA ligase) (nucleomorph) [Cryptomonas paramecium]|uniref:serine--tRNA ligase n=1 Tax=Cryptomonas paramaecium TaxID=2898 RepID=F2HI82_9CRYP|nr:seryl-tRNA synthetase (serin-tRNA ligase) [Cryptomonas paramecium]AEA39006.1 seryl-tRNA synthetase (serin-tRNA ligase) [Cryptomonas paramecium]|mmetsp:Transcript_36645/g.96589  ORF Transcript_36645/g.96589 Transcript_36645/m.96589 type:complete len:443 (-) Transcript_36645:8382-9710(-)
MIDSRIFFLKQQTNFSDIIRGSQCRRCVEKSKVEQIIILSHYYNKNKIKWERIKYVINVFSKKIIFNMIKERVVFVNYSKEKINLLEKKMFTYQNINKFLITSIGNLVHNSSMFSMKVSNSKLIFLKQISIEKKQKLIFLNHVDLLSQVEGVEYQKGIVISGNRGYFLKKLGLLLNAALIQYSLDFLQKRNFVPIQTPYFMKKNIMMKCAQLEDFKEQLYCIKEETEKFLIATSEQPISALHVNQKILKKNLPIKYAGFSSCFRKESGSHGKDTAGIFRVHQFEKIEQFIICEREEISSWVFFQEILKNARDFYFLLNIPFKVINISSTTFNNTASKKADVLGWFPASNTFRELVSCSNCTDFQARNLNIISDTNFHTKNNKFVYMLNSTLCATTRVICCILENYQFDKFIHIPRVLKKYMGNSNAHFINCQDNLLVNKLKL